MGLRVEFDLGTFRFYIARRAVLLEQPCLDFLLPQKREGHRPTTLGLEVDGSLFAGEFA